MEYGKFIQIISLRQQKEGLKRLLKNESGELEVSAKRLMEVVESAGCETLVVESEYLDSDFRDSHKHFYYLHYKDTHHRCQRIHFFASDVGLDDLASLPDSVASTYLGFSVIRPLPGHIIGCTVLRDSIINRMFPRAYPRETRHLLCSANQEVNLVGNRIRFQGTPWMQQDRLVAACASIAIWIANRHLADRYPRDFKRATSARITKLATQTNPATGRGMPSDGLTAEQMVIALTALGYEPLYIETEAPRQAARICAEYVRSSVPVIAVLTYPEGGHAVTIVGHTTQPGPIYDQQETGRGGTGATSYDLSEFIPRFIIQDDSAGPFRFLEFISWEDAVGSQLVTAETRARLESRFSSVVKISPADGADDVAYLTCLLVPLPLRVTLKASLAHRNAREVVREFMIQSGEIAEQDLVFDTYLVPSNDYKVWWSPLNRRPPDFAPLIRRHPLPYWIWITEVSNRERMRGNGEILAHVIQDSSGRGTRHLRDDLIALIGPKTIVLAFPDATFERSSRARSSLIATKRGVETI